ncbi:MAG: DoxX family protein [Planctomycetes bacterium]|nr:DoxX family protein [Planctomycetota bacterium]
MSWFKLLMKWLFAMLFIVAGVLHFIRQDFYLRIMPPYLPAHLELVWLSGAFEICLAVLLLIPRYTAYSAWGLIALLIAVFPANVHMAINSQLFPEISPSFLWARLPMQGVLVAWAWWFAK